MNYLAHCFLSGNSVPLLIGNLIADSVRGKNFNSYSKEIQAGIKLHRLIDNYTDHHPTVTITKLKLFREVGKYAPVLLDIYFDHFLAIEWSIYSKENLAEYVQRVYNLVEGEKENLPDEFKKIFYYMRKYNWLLNYGTIEGIDSALKGMSQRVKFKPLEEFSATTLLKDYSWYQENFNIFFPQVVEFTEKEIFRINND